MKFYVLVISQTVNGEDRQTFSYTSRDAAIQKYHSQMASSMVSTQINSIQVMVINSDNGVAISDKWTRPAEV